MKSTFNRQLLATAVCWVLAGSAIADSGDKKPNGNSQTTNQTSGSRCSGKVFRVDAATQTFTNEKVRGPICVEVSGVNVLRYDAQLGSTSTFTPGPDLSGLGFVPSVAKPAAKTDTTMQTTKSASESLHALGLDQQKSKVDPIDVKFGDIVDRLNTVEKKVSELIDDIDTANETVRAAGARIKALVESSDAFLRGGGGPTALLTEIGKTLESIKLDSAVWPSSKIESQKGTLAILKNDLEALKSLEGWSTWYSIKGAAYESIKARVAELQTGLKALDSNSDTAKKFGDALDNVRRWLAILTGVKTADSKAFTLSTCACCGFSFGDTKSTKIELIKRDRLATAGTAPTKDEIVTIECTTPFSISGGFGFSSVNEREFVFVSSKPPAGTTSPINTFGFKNNSSFRTIPLVLINTRVYEWNDSIALHASAGVGVDIKTGQPAAGTDIEYIVGGSLSFKRGFFVTTGVHIGRVSSLAGGFNLGDTVPSGLSAPPIEKTWKPGFIVAFSYKIK